MESRWIDWLEEKGIPKRLYKVNENGQIWSTESEQFLTPQNNKGYLEYDLKSEGTRVKAKGHRITCRAFHGPPPPEKTEVDHLNMARYDNSAGNLEWVNHSENIQRRNASGSDPGGKAKKPVLIINMRDSPNEGRILLSHTDAIAYLDCTPARFYTALSKNSKLDNYRIVTISNPEEISNERNQNKEQCSNDQRTGQARAGDGPGTQEGRSSSQEGSKSEALSTYATQVLFKWKIHSENEVEGSKEI